MQEIMQFIGRHPVLSIAWIALLGAVVFTTFKGLMSKVKVITRGEATRLINKEDAVVVLSLIPNSAPTRPISIW